MLIAALNSSRSRVRGSATKFVTIQITATWALNSAVECHLHTVEVTGSNPVAPTKFPEKVSELEVLPLRLRSGSGFACGLKRPQTGSSSNPVAPTKLAVIPP